MAFLFVHIYRSLYTVHVIKQWYRLRTAVWCSRYGCVVTVSRYVSTAAHTPTISARHSGQ